MGSNPTLSAILSPLLFSDFPSPFVFVYPPCI